MRYLSLLCIISYTSLISAQIRNTEKLNFLQNRIKNLYIKEKYNKCISVGHKNISKGNLDRLSYYYLALSCFQLYKTKNNKYLLDRSVRYLVSSKFKSNDIVKQIALNDKKILKEMHHSLIDLAKIEFDEKKLKYQKRLNYAKSVFEDTTDYTTLWNPVIPKITESSFSKKNRLSGHDFFIHLSKLFDAGFFSSHSFSTYLKNERNEDLNEIESKMLNKISAFYGLSEIEGKKHNHQIISFFHELGYNYINDDETPWCAAFMNFCAKQIGAYYPSGLRARNWMKCGKSSSKPSIGDVVVFGYGGKNSKAGHVAMYISEDFDSIYCLGGNQSNLVTISSYCKSDLLGYRKLVINQKQKL